MDQPVARAKTTVEVWWVKLKSWLKMIVPLLGFSILATGVYGMVIYSAATGLPPLEAVELPFWDGVVREVGLVVGHQWWFSIPAGAAIAHFSLKI